ncbi:hypothetical protein, partial [Prevotella denticola]|uniref:hypothetical protein n=1 Tax=Prevotella denticola TaxID=28129 RepID=UPI0028E59E2A
KSHYLKGVCGRTDGRSAAAPGTARTRTCREAPELPHTSIGLESPQIIPPCAHNPRTGHGGGNG